MIFSNDDILKISTILQINTKEFEGGWTWVMKSSDNSKPLVATLHNNVNLGNDVYGSLISVQTQYGYYELHNIEKYMFFEPDELIFISSTSEYLSCLTIGRQSVCSLFSTIKREILSEDISELDPAVLMAAMQLSITEPEFEIN